MFFSDYIFSLYEYVHIVKIIFRLSLNNLLINCIIWILIFTKKMCHRLQNDLVENQTIKYLHWFINKISTFSIRIKFESLEHRFHPHFRGMASIKQTPRLISTFWRENSIFNDIKLRVSRPQIKILFPRRNGGQKLNRVQPPGNKMKNSRAAVYCRQSIPVDGEKGRRRLNAI